MWKRRILVDLSGRGCSKTKVGGLDPLFLTKTSPYFGYTVTDLNNKSKIADDTSSAGMDGCVNLRIEESNIGGIPSGIGLFDRETCRDFDRDHPLL